jgi:predicted secreted protein
MRRLLILILFLILATALIGCNGEQEVTAPGQTIDVEAGEEFTIVLDSNPTTGFEWRLVEDTPDAAVVEFVDKEYEPSRPVATGSGGQDIWTFRAVAAGETEIKMGHFPPDGTADAHTINSYTVIVR